MEGEPDPAHVSASYVERQHLTMRMHMRRFTRLTNAFSKKVESHAAMVAIYSVWYNFVRIHKSGLYIGGPGGRVRVVASELLARTRPCADQWAGGKRLARGWDPTCSSPRLAISLP